MVKVETSKNVTCGKGGSEMKSCMSNTKKDFCMENEILK